MDPDHARLAEANRAGTLWLAADQADCLSPNPAGFGSSEPMASVYDLPLSDDLTRDLLIQACLDGYDHDQSGARADGELCVRGGAFPRPVVAIEWTCAEVAAVRPASADDVAKLNAMRAIEVALMADPTACPTEEDTVAWTERILREQQLDLQVHVHNEPHVEHGSSEVSPPVVCPLLTRVDWDEGVVYVEPFHS
jgi:hypothetical protein